MTKPPAALALLLGLAACDEEHVVFNDASLGELPDDVARTAPGAPCGTNEQGEPVGGCSAGQRCVSPAEGFPNGYCAPDCRTMPCPEGSVCYPASATRHFCLRRCARDAECRAAEGYACRAWGPGANPGCLPTDQPLGRRDGGACFSDDDAGVAPPLAPLPTGAFSGEVLSVTRERARTFAEAEATIALDPVTRGATAAFMGLDDRGFWRGGLARVAADGASATLQALDDFDFPDVLQPVIAYDRAGRLHLAYVATNPDIPGNALRHTAGAEVTLPRARSVVPPLVCGLACEAPALAVGPDVGGARDAVYVAAVAGQRDGSRSVVFARAPAEGGDFEASQVLAARDDSVQPRRDPSLAALTAGPEAGLVLGAWVALNAGSPLAALGDRVNRVRLRTSRDGGRTWAEPEGVSRDTDAPVSQVPWVARAAGVTHVVYVTGGLQGRWDVVLATRRDGDAWRHRAVNDEPERCATHGFAGLAADARTGDAHLVWLDARFGVGAVAYARCPADPSQRCRRNERVSAAPFALTTSRDPARWHGTRASLALAGDGALWAAWSDTRTGGPGVYLARGAAP